MMIKSLLLAVGVVLSASSSHAGLKVSGTSILADGKPFMLRGVAVGDPLLAREGRPLSDYERIAHDWHANAVRIGIHPSVWKRTSHELILAKLKEEIDAALHNGLYVIIDWHVIGWPDGYYQKPDAAWDEDPADLYDSNFEIAKSFWAAISKQFGKDGRILFELWNEPVSAADQDDSETTARPDRSTASPPPAWKELKPKWAELEALIRKHSKNIILVTGNEWAYNLRGIKNDPLPGANVAYSWHIYAGHDENDESAWAEALDDLQKFAPVVVCEWGFQRHTKEHFKGTPESFGNKFVKNFLDGRGLHSTAWCWHPDWTPAMLRKDWKTPTEMGAFVMRYLASHQPIDSQSSPTISSRNKK